MSVESRLRDANPVPNTAQRTAASLLGRTVRVRVDQRISRAGVGGWKAPRRRPRHLAVATTIGVAAAAALVAVVAGPGTTPANPGSPHVDGRVARVLLTLAAAAGVPTPAGTGRYAYTAFVIPDYSGAATMPTPSGSVTYASYLSATVQTWVAADGSGRRVTTVDPTPEFFTAADRAAWIAAGEPPVPHLGPLTTVSTFGPGTGSEIHSPVPLYDVRGLPTSASALKKVLSATQLPEALAAVDDTWECSGSCRLFQRVVALLQGPDRGGTAALRSALFSVLASVPGIELLGTTSIHGSPEGTGFQLTVRTPAATWDTYCINPDGESIIKRISGSTGSTRGIVYHTPASTQTLTAVVDPTTTTLVYTGDASTPERFPVAPEPCPTSRPIPSGSDGYSLPTWQILTASGTTSTDQSPPTGSGNTT